MGLWLVGVWTILGVMMLALARAAGRSDAHADAWLDAILRAEALRTLDADDLQARARAVQEATGRPDADVLLTLALDWFSRAAEPQLWPGGPVGRVLEVQPLSGQVVVAYRADELLGGLARMRGQGGTDHDGAVSGLGPGTGPRPEPA